MMNEMTQFDKSVKWYDRLSKLVFGQKLRNVELHLIPYLPHTGTVLWIGGGSGHNLPVIMEARPDLGILYFDTSEKMRNLAKARIFDPSNRITFLDSYAELEDHQKEVSSVLMFFVLDLFEDNELTEVLFRWLVRNGAWVKTLLVADFDRPQAPLGSLVASVLIPIMYTFFRITIQLPSRKLPDWKKTLGELGYSEEDPKEELMGVIRSGLWRYS